MTRTPGAPGDDSPDFAQVTLSGIKHWLAMLACDPNRLDSLQAYYSNGRCVALALALHWLLGVKISVTLVQAPGHKDYIGHAWVVLPDGRPLDIMGAYDNDIEMQAFGDKCIHGLDAASVIALLPHTHNLAEEAACATLVAEYYLLPKSGDRATDRAKGVDAVTV